MAAEKRRYYMNMTEDFSLKALVLGAMRLSSSVESQKLLKPYALKVFILIDF